MSISLSIKDERLIIQNTLRPRLDQESLGIGIPNLKEKYQLLNRSAPTFEKESDRYTVSLPFFKMESFK